MVLADYWIEIIITVIVIAIPAFLFQKKNGKNPIQEKEVKEEDAPKPKLNLDHHEEETDPSKMSLKQLKKLAAKGNQKHKHKKPSHEFYCGTLQTVNSQIIDYDVSKDGNYILVTTESNKHHLIELKKTLMKKTSQDITFETRSPPDCVAISEMGNYMALSFNDKATIYYKKGGKISPLAHKDKDTNRTKIVGLYLSETADVFMTLGSEKDPNVYIMNLHGALLHTIKTQLNSPEHFSFDKDNFRFVVICKNSASRVYKLQTDTISGKFKGVDVEYLCAGVHGHNNYIIATTFNSDGSRYFTLGKDHKLKVWNLKDAVPFIDVNPQVIREYDIQQEYTIMEWVGSEGDQDIISLVGLGDIDFYKTTDNGLVKLATIQDPHVGNAVKKITNSDKKLSQSWLVTKCCSKIYTWAPKFSA